MFTGQKVVCMNDSQKIKVGRGGVALFLSVYVCHSLVRSAPFRCIQIHSIEQWNNSAKTLIKKDKQRKIVRHVAAETAGTLELMVLKF